MSKMKTHTGAKKRFVALKSGKVKRKQQGHRHILSNKNRKRKRQLKTTLYIDGANMYQTERLLAK
jgi:large subunit ribosomal protein L35